MNSNSDTDFEPANPAAVRAVLTAVAVSLALAFASQSGPLLKPYLAVEAIKDIPYARAALTTLVDLSVLAVLLRLAGVSFGAQAQVSGLFAPVGQPVLFALLAFAPAVAVCTLLLPLSLTATASDLAWQVFIAPFTEEFAFRGLAVGVLMRLCGWPLVAACLWPAAFFGAAHAWQGDGMAEVAGVVAITGVGGLLFGWLFVRWGFNLWPPVFLHVGLNGLWLLFDLGENAIGGWFGNGVRFGTVALAILVTVWLTRRSGPEPS